MTWTERRAWSATLADGSTVFGEQVLVPEPHGSVVLLHDAGGDLDAVRPLEHPALVLGLNVVAVDLPGHGLSEGEPGVGDQEAIGACVRAAADLTPSVGVLVEGATAEALLRGPTRDVVAVAWLAPRLGPEVLVEGSDWQTIPTVAVGDPCDAEQAEALDRLALWIRAWSLRFFVHEGCRDEPPGHPVHASAASYAFVAEQIAHANLSREARQRAST